MCYKKNRPKNKIMNNQDNEYNEYSNNLIHKNGKEPGFFGWVWIAVQVIMVCAVMILYLIGSYVAGNIKYFTSELRTQPVRTLLKYGIFLSLMYVLMHILNVYFPLRITRWMTIIPLASPFVVPFYIFDMCLFKSQKISEL